MGREANGRKSDRSWDEISYGEAAGFGYTPKQVDEMRAREAAELARIRARLAEMTRAARAAAGGGR